MPFQGALSITHRNTENEKLYGGTVREVKAKVGNTGEIFYETNLNYLYSKFCVSFMVWCCVVWYGGDLCVVGCGDQNNW